MKSTEGKVRIDAIITTAEYETLKELAELSDRSITKMASRIIKKHIAGYNIYKSKIEHGTDKKEN